MSEKRKIVTITLTESCNLNCTYCYERNKSAQFIKFDLAKKIIDNEINQLDDFDEIEFDLFGGEPFLAFDEVKSITEYIVVRCNEEKVPFIIFATTNGTLVHGNVQEWLIANSEVFKCGLSLDGTKHMHDMNRSNSFDDIDIDFFKSNYPEQDIKMTISVDSLPYLSEGVKYLHSLGFTVSCNLAYQIDWSNKDNVTILNRELLKLIDFYLENPNITPCSMLEMGINSVGCSDDKAVRYCGAGKETKAYDINGNVYPCQFFMPLSIGEEKAKLAPSIDFPDDEITDDLLDEKCIKCVAKSLCPNCYGSNFASTGNIFSRDDNMCKLNKIIIKARSFLYAQKWQKGLLKDSPETLSILRAIVNIQEKLEI